MSDISEFGAALTSYFNARIPAEQVDDVAAGDGAAALWNELEELGFTLVSVPESAGGTGGDLSDLLLLLRIAGGHAVPLPLAETALLAGWALDRAGLKAVPGMASVAPAHPEDGVRAEVREDGGLRLFGAVSDVPWAAMAARIVVLAVDGEDRLWVAVVDRSLVDIIPGRNLAGEPRDGFVLDGLQIPATDARLASFDLESYFLRAALGRACLMLGALERARDLTVSYAKVREQFGRPLSQFQAVQQMIAQIARDVALVRASVELASTAVAERASGGWLEIAAAKSLAGQAAGTVSALAHQVHGAIGITSEYPLSIITRRLWAWRAEQGSQEQWARRIGERAAADPEGMWAFVTAAPLPTS